MRIVALALMAGAFASPAWAQDPRPDSASITVVGTARLERPPDRFRIVAEIDGRGTTQVDALAQLAGRQADVAAGLNRLEGLTVAELTTGKPTVRPVRQSGCESDYRQEGTCPITGYLGETSVVLEGAPVERAGNAVSLAAEKGATSASIQGFFLSDSSALRAEADESAFTSARQQADRLARASGQRIVRILRIQDPDAMRSPGYGGLTVDVDELADRVPLGRTVTDFAFMAPRVLLDVTPEPVAVSSSLVVVFEIE